MKTLGDVAEFARAAVGDHVNVVACFRPEAIRDSRISRAEITDVRVLLAGGTAVAYWSREDDAWRRQGGEWEILPPSTETAIPASSRVRLTSSWGAAFITGI